MPVRKPTPVEMIQLSEISFFSLQFEEMTVDYEREWNAMCQAAVTREEILLEEEEETSIG